MSGNEPHEGWLGIGEVARRAAVSVDTVRHYEKLGILIAAERSLAGYRKFRPAAVQRIGEIRSALELGFGLAELVVAMRSRERGHPPCRAVRDLLAAKQTELEREIALLKKRRQRVIETLESWDRQLEGSPKDRLVGLLFGHGAKPSAPVADRARLSKRNVNPRSRRRQP